MIFLENSKLVKMEDYDEIWIITRNYVAMPKGASWIPDLAPSKELFLQYCEWKKKKKWNKDTFQNEYVPIFLQEMYKQTAKDKLNELFQKDKKGIRVAICCPCDSEGICHRSIVGGLLKGVGCEVYCKEEYRTYYQMYIQKKEQP